jgi:hypothetical protein
MELRKNNPPIGGGRIIGWPLRNKGKYRGLGEVGAVLNIQYFRPWYHLPELRGKRGPDGGISAMIPADKSAVLRQARQAPVPSDGATPEQ